MCCFNHYTDAFGLQYILNTVRDLRGHFLLDLKATGKCLNDSSELAYANDLVVRQIADVRSANNGCHVAFEMGFILRIPHEDHLVVPLDLLKGALKIFDGLYLVAAEPVSVGERDSL